MFTLSGSMILFIKNICSQNSKTNQIRVNNVNNMVFGYDNVNKIFYIEFYFTASDIYRLDISGQNQMIAWDYFNGTSWTTIWTK